MHIYIDMQMEKPNKEYKNTYAYIHFMYVCKAVEASKWNWKLKFIEIGIVIY